MSAFHLFDDALAAQLVARDLEKLERGWLPGPAELDAAPILFDWGFHGAVIPTLKGRCLGHPDLRDGLLVTSRLVAIDTEASTWARTRSRWYRLAGVSEVDHGGQ